MSAKIILFGGITRLDWPSDQVLEQAKEECTGDVIVIGCDDDGEMFFASSMADGAVILWYIEMFKKALLEVVE